MSQYLHVQCLEYALLLDTECVEQVVAIDTDGDELESIQWRDRDLDIVDLTVLFNGKKLQANQHYLIIRDTDKDSALAVSVGQVLNVESIAEQNFCNIPQLSFNVQDYFDKAYIHPQTKQCVYRLKVDALFGATV